MSSGHSICLKHLKRNCKCNSPKKIGLHHSFRVPPDGNINDWKIFIKWMISTKNSYLESRLTHFIPGTPLENYYKRLIKK